MENANPLGEYLCARRELVNPDDVGVRVTGLNDIQAAGKGIMSADRSRVDYEIYELQ